jgi:hypothetical protein
VSCFLPRRKAPIQANRAIGGNAVGWNDVVSQLSSEMLGSSKLGTGGASFENVGKVASRSFDNLEGAQ